MLAILVKLWENDFSYMEDFNLKDSSQPLKMRGGLFILAGVLITLLIVLLYPAHSFHCIIRTIQDFVEIRTQQNFLHLSLGLIH